MLAKEQLSARDVAADAAKVAGLMHNIVTFVPMAYMQADRGSFKFDFPRSRCNVPQDKRFRPKYVSRELRSPPLVAALHKCCRSLLAPTVLLVMYKILPRPVDVTVKLHSAGVIVVLVPAATVNSYTKAVLKIGDGACTCSPSSPYDNRHEYQSSRAPKRPAWYNSTAGGNNIPSRTCYTCEDSSVGQQRVAPDITQADDVARRHHTRFTSWSPAV